MKLDAISAERVGALWLRAAIAPAGDFGRRAEDAARPFGSGDEEAARSRCEQIVSLAAQLHHDGVEHVRAALRRAPDPVDVISRAEAGDPLGDVDFFELGRFVDALEATARAWDGAGGPAARRPPVAAPVVELLSRGRTTAGSFYLADAFAPTLGDARSAYAAADAGVGRARARLARAIEPLTGPLPHGEEFIVMRDVLPEVPPGVRVVRETPAYRLLALELDADALAAAARREAAAAAVAVAEDAVRRDLARAVVAHGPELLAAAAALGELDRTLARVAFTQRWGGCVPEFNATGFAFERASFAPLRAALEAAGLPYTPISIALRGAAVLTGPNMGGKSAALATCGFLAVCLAHGVPPPASRAALPLVATVSWIGGEQSADRARLLSAFGGEVVRMRDALRAAEPPALLLIDEFARTTGPREGRALLVAVVEEIARRGLFALVSTHFDGIAVEAGVTGLAIAGLGPHALDGHPARDVAAALDAVARAMDYRVIEPAAGAAGHSRSDALALAGLLGLDAAVVERATALFGAAEPDRPSRLPNDA